MGIDRRYLVSYKSPDYRARREVFFKLLDQALQYAAEKKETGRADIKLHCIETTTKKCKIDLTGQQE